MATTSISITPQFGSNTVTVINCGTSSPRLGGTIDLSAFPNLQDFRCNSNDITDLSGYTNNSNLIVLEFFNNKVTGSIPSLNGLTNLEDFLCYSNQLTGPIPALSGLTALEVFWCQNQTGTKLTGSIPSLSGLTALRSFRCNNNQLTGTIPALSGLNNLEVFYCYFNQHVGFAGGPVPNTLGDFQAQNNLLNQSSIDAILSAFDATTRTTGTKVLNLGGTGNAAPSYTGGVTTTSPGSNFSRSGTLVTANVTGHGHPNGSLVTISGINETTLQGTYVITVVNANQFQYTTINSGTVTGTGTATMRRTTVATDGFRYYQNLAVVTRLGGFNWGVTIIFP